MTRKEIKKLDSDFRFLVRNGKSCFRCGASQGVQASHVIPVSTCGYGLRWELKNCIPLCYRCHIHWWHKNPIEAFEWFKAQFGARRLAWLNKKKLETNKYITSQEVRAGWRRK